LFGTKDWFDAVERGVIHTHLVKGIISRVYMTGQNDFPEFEIENNESITNWPKFGEDAAYQVGKDIELTYVEQEFKRQFDLTGPISKCVIEIRISE